ncbi:Aminomethyltransferase folate-binding domain-containing protein [Backusella circina FSU 941]|nr:Aminomethyltransferase folate-binding domain-containing protein [Backusella circina FSU 941]
MFARRTHNIALGLFKKPHVTLTRSFVSSSPIRPFHEKDTVHKEDRYCEIPNRSVIELEGVDSVKFLQGLITNHMPRISPGGDGFYAGFLTPQGRMLFDTFIYPVNMGVNFPHPKYVIDCPTATKDIFLRHLKRYLLRSKVKVRDCSEEYKLWHVWGNASANHLEPNLIKKDMRLSDIGCTDPRVPGFGYRAVLKTDQKIESILPEAGDFKQLSSEEYTIRRILQGIPEGVEDIWPETSLPLESNFDYMNGVDFRKGCYVGQELTIRTYHTGVVRKRIVPIQIYTNGDTVPQTQSVDRSKQYSLEPQKDIKLVDGSSKRGVGKLCSTVHNIGLALMRLEHVQKCVNGEQVEFCLGDDSETRFRPFLPEWWSEDEIFNKQA